MAEQDILQALHDMELRMTKVITTHTALLDDHCDRLDILFEKAQRSEREIFGMGEKEGFVTKVALLEDYQRTTKKAVAGAYTGLLGVIWKMVSDYFKV